MPTLLHGSGCSLGGVVGDTPSYALIGGYAIGVRVALLWQHNSKRNVSEYMLVLAVCLVIIVRPRRSTTSMRPIVTDGVAWSVGLSVCLSVCHSRKPCKTAEPIEMQSGT